MLRKRFAELIAKLSPAASRAEARTQELLRLHQLAEKAKRKRLDRVRSGRERLTTF